LLSQSQPHNRPPSNSAASTCGMGTNLNGRGLHRAAVGLHQMAAGQGAMAVGNRCSNNRKHPRLRSLDPGWPTSPHPPVAAEGNSGHPLGMAGAHSFSSSRRARTIAYTTIVRTTTTILPRCRRRASLSYPNCPAVARSCLNERIIARYPGVYPLLDAGATGTETPSAG
jgi:hypothetical protein